MIRASEAERRWINAFYLERGNELIEFEMQHGGVLTDKPRRLDCAKTNQMDAVELLKCQLGAAKGGPARGSERLEWAVARSGMRMIAFR